MPVDFDPVDDGDFVLARQPGAVDPLAIWHTKAMRYGIDPHHVDRFTSHFKTCPDRAPDRNGDVR